MLERLAAAIDRLSTLGGWLAAAAIAGILALVTLEIALRTFVGISTQISDEVCGYLNVAAIYFGLAMSLKDGSYVRVEPIYERLTGRAGLAVRWVIVLASLAYMVVAIVIMWRYIGYNFRIGIASTSFSRTPLWIPQVPILIGSVLLVLQLAAFLLRGGRKIP